ncbi:LOW QUALITY PROTEIN: flavanone 3-dioxygenase 3-like [Coffea eugenioides]|uniref:LOW QUALITY PROTEIN: flavanone 3-dioxygenase 3-like n=1 Tax=Coffea eugenioides TaxID=49369 RepID=UPI000F605C39|nr:LOW QUALITY PROTEIN: flavanone 3-dioxygenase 3-like [Coffea eugenioides]
MEAKHEESSSFPMGETPQEKGGFGHVPQCYKVAPLSRPSLHPGIANIPVVDLNGLNNSTRRSAVIKDISSACGNNGFFQIVDHGISQSVLDGALSAAFNLPSVEKVKFMSIDVRKPVRYGTSIKDGVDKVQFWRTFLKHYANPLDDWLSLWPDTPHDYREKMSEYAREAKKLGVSIMGAITEGLGLGPDYISRKMEEGMQVIVVNCYPPLPMPCPQQGLALDCPPPPPPHKNSDYSCLTIVLHSSSGLQTLDSRDGKWTAVRCIHGALQVNVGDHLEVLSNGLYKSVVHRVTLSSDTIRISIASLHSLGMDEKVETAKELIDEQHPKGYSYRDSSFKHFLDFFAQNDIADRKSFIDALRITNQ